MDMDFAIGCPLVLPQLPRYPVAVRRIASSLHTSFRRFLAVPPLCFTRASPPSGCTGDFHPQAAGHAQHTALRLRRTATRLWGLTATRLAESSALVPSMTRSVRRRSRAASILAATDRGGCQEAKELATGCIEGALLGFGLAMGEQRPAIIANEVEDDLLDRPPAETHCPSAIGG